MLNPEVFPMLAGVAVALMLILPFYLKRDDKSLKEYEKKCKEKYANRKTIIFTIDEKFERTLNELNIKLKQFNLAKTFRLAIALLNIAVKGRDKNLNLVLVNDEDKIIRKIILPEDKGV